MSETFHDSHLDEMPPRALAKDAPPDVSVLDPGLNEPEVVLPAAYYYDLPGGFCAVTLAREGDPEGANDAARMTVRLIYAGNPESLRSQTMSALASEFGLDADSAQQVSDAAVRLDPSNVVPDRAEAEKPKPPTVAERREMERQNAVMAEGKHDTKHDTDRRHPQHSDDPKAAREA